MKVILRRKYIVKVRAIITTPAIPPTRPGLTTHGAPVRERLCDQAGAAGGGDGPF